MLDQTNRARSYNPTRIYAAFNIIELLRWQRKERWAVQAVSDRIALFPLRRPTVVDREFMATLTLTSGAPTGPKASTNAGKKRRPMSSPDESYKLESEIAEVPDKEATSAIMLLSPRIWSRGQSENLESVAAVTDHSCWPENGWFLSSISANNSTLGVTTNLTLRIVVRKGLVAVVPEVRFGAAANVIVKIPSVVGSVY